MNSAHDQQMKATQVEVHDQFQLKVSFGHNKSSILDLKSLIFSRDVYWRLRQPRYFSQVSLDPLGGICWPEGEDLAPDGLYRYMI